jgi:hypothetical protein
MLTFLARIHHLREKAGDRAFPRASEGVFSLDALLANLRSRRDRLRTVHDTEVHEFLTSEFDKLLPIACEHASGCLKAYGLKARDVLPLGSRTLSPSDLGFHNALRLANDALVFVDLEYFGWDDPAKLISDFLLQPEQCLTQELRNRFLEGSIEIYGDALLSQRQALYMPFFRLKWATILLNEFMRADRARRDFAALESVDARLRCTRQLEKARLMLQPLHTSLVSSTLT